MGRKRENAYHWPDSSLMVWSDDELLRSLDEFREAVAEGRFYPKEKAGETLMRIEAELIARGLDA